eukprot:CAMPEP_0171281748 /NCGR_PEP_ID=MMETSP0790-20130122/66561_1 /TAXON_ID=2925 /ORGANISM="Alexandrium catenella, Strain OF101" /LENGTH=74 /DNA_ID=CAMNT_0011750979 /DNA_START=94 /DNA_END=318 /DNA_ORIENTATION=+
MALRSAAAVPELPAGFSVRAAWPQGVAALWAACAGGDAANAAGAGVTAKAGGGVAEKAMAGELATRCGESAPAG